MNTWLFLLEPNRGPALIVIHRTETNSKERKIFFSKTSVVRIKYRLRGPAKNACNVTCQWCLLFRKWIPCHFIRRPPPLRSTVIMRTYSVIITSDTVSDNSRHNTYTSRVNWIFHGNCLKDKILFWFPYVIFK